MILAHIGPSLTCVQLRGGRGGNIAADIKAKAASDGYTIMVGTIRTHAVNYSLYSKLPYHPARDFTSIALSGKTRTRWTCIRVLPRIPFRNASHLPWRAPVY